jgi:hypothetical protein
LSKIAGEPSASSRFTFGQKCILATVPTLLSILVKLIFLTSRKIVINEEIWDTINRNGDHCLAATWHENISVSAHIMKNRGFSSLISQSFDGELTSRTLKKFDIDSVRGSSSRGGLKALGELLKVLDDIRVVGITIDGPRGPRRKAKHGIAMLSAQSGLPILPIVSTAIPNKRFNSWDRFLLPLPFSKTILAFGELIEPAKSVQGDCIREKTLEIESKMNALQENLESTYNIDAHLDPSN